MSIMSSEQAERNVRSERKWSLIAGIVGIGIFVPCCCVAAIGLIGR